MEENLILENIISTLSSLGFDSLANTDESTVILFYGGPLRPG